MGHHGGIMENRHRPLQPSLMTLIADGPQWDLAPFPRSSGAGDGVRKKGGNRYILIRNMGGGVGRAPIIWRIKDFKNSGILIPGKSTGAIRGIPVPGVPRRYLGPETPAPTRGDAGMASSLVITWG